MVNKNKIMPRSSHSAKKPLLQLTNHQEQVTAEVHDEPGTPNPEISSSELHQEQVTAPGTPNPASIDQSKPQDTTSVSTQDEIMPIEEKAAKNLTGEKTGTVVPKMNTKEKNLDVNIKEELTIVLAGKSGAGKSTLVHNLFGIKKQKKKLSPQPDTELIKTQRVKKNDVTITIIDTIGFKEDKREKQKQLKELSNYVRGKADYVIYCLPVGPGTRFNDANPAIMKSLQDAFGKDIWKHCMVALTFSNLAWDYYSEECEDAECTAAEYKEYITEYAQQFQNELVKLKVRDVDVTTIFQCQSTEEAEDSNGRTTIVAIPAGKISEDQQFMAGFVFTKKTPGIPTEDDPEEQEMSEEEAEPTADKSQKDEVVAKTDNPPANDDNTQVQELQEIEVKTDKWTGIIIAEMIERSTLEYNIALLQFWYGKTRLAQALQRRTGINVTVRSSIGIGLTGGVLGGGMGAGAGFAIGSLGGPVGISIGVAIGLVAGIIAGSILIGGTTGGTADFLHSLSHNATEKEKQENTKRKRNFLKH